VRNLWILFVRELLAYFTSPVGWVIAVMFYLFRGYEVSKQLWVMSRAQWDVDLFTRSYVQLPSSYLVFVLVPPILTMRTFAEERRTGSLEMLMTAPVRDHEVVLGKFLAAWAYFVVLWLPTFVVLGVLQSPLFLNAPVELGPVAFGYLGLVAVGSLFLSVGLFTSSLTENQLLASLSSMIFNYMLLVVPGYLVQGDEPLIGIAGALVAQINIMEHLSGWFFRGLIASEHLVFYLTSAALFLFLTVRSVESRKWR
jgi:ABC-2 type transport system permease protein